MENTTDTSPSTMDSTEVEVGDDDVDASYSYDSATHQQELEKMSLYTA